MARYSSWICSSTPDDRMVLDGVYRVLEPGGVAIASVPAFSWLWSYWDETAGHRRRYSRRMLTTLITSEHLQLEKIRYYQCLLFPLLVVTRLLGRCGAGMRDLEEQPRLGLNAVLAGINRTEVRLGARSLAVGLVHRRRLLEAMSEDNVFSLLLFSTDPGFIQRTEAAGVDGFIVDWEQIGKIQRQNGADTEINRHGLSELQRVRATAGGLVLCRINGPGETTIAEIELAIRAGADEILLPMVTSPVEVEQVLDQVAGRCGVGILIETIAAVRRAEEFASLPLTRVYVGLNDLAIARGSRTIFDAVIDGTVERVRQWFTMPFGFGGLTLPDAGSPIPCRLLIGEMMRLDCQFSFLRRSFHRDIRGHDPLIELPRLRAALREARSRDCPSVALNRLELEAAVTNWAESMAPNLAPLLDV